MHDRGRTKRMRRAMEKISMAKLRLKGLTWTTEGQKFDEVELSER